MIINNSHRCFRILFNQYAKKRYSFKVSNFIRNSSSITSPLNNNVHEFKNTIVLDPPSFVQNEPGKLLPSAFSENLSLLYACLKTGDIERAERILNILHNSGPREMKHYLDISVHNTFIEEFIESTPTPRLNQALIWFDRLERYDVKPDLKTFAILVKGYLKLDLDFVSFTMLKVLIDEMEQNGHTFEQLMNAQLLSEKDIIKVLQLLKSDQDRISESKVLIEKVEDAIDKQEIPQKIEDDVVKSTKSDPPIGVELLRNTLSALQHDNLNLYEQQMKLEENAIQAAIERWKHDTDALLKHDDKLLLKRNSPLKKVMWEWHEKLEPLINEEIKRCKNPKILAKDVDRKLYGPFLQLLSADKLSAITILEFVRNQSTGGVIQGMKTTRLIISIGKSIENEYNAEQMKKRKNRMMIQKKLNVHELYSSGKLFNMAVRKVTAKIERENSNSEWQPEWPTPVKAKIGSLLASMLLDCAKLKVFAPDVKLVQEVPAFYHTYEMQKGKIIGIIQYNPQLVKFLSSNSVVETLTPRLLPMLVHPMPWLNYNSGGYLMSPTIAMRIKECPEQLAYLKKASDEDYLGRVFAGLDVLGSTKWAINKKVYEVVLEVWNSGKAIADIPPSNLDLTTPEKPEDFLINIATRKKWYRECEEIQNKIHFRGRAYPIPTHLNHLGDDLCRGLLLFDEAKPIGKSGLKWLKIQIANLAGHDKASFDERLKFTEDKLELIMDSADKPLTGKCWWQTTEDPWQCLSACMELTNALRAKDPETYVSRIPIHQDGTCNGLQHYAALGGDLEGAKQVNLDPSDKPCDIYTGIAEKVQKLIKKDIENGNKNATILDGKITRKVVKQTVMTSVYGVTFVGARLQIENQLKEIKELSRLPTTEIRELSKYVTHHVFSCLGEMFHKARLIQNWLNESAKRISKSVPPNVVLNTDEETKQEIKEDHRSKIKPGKDQMTAVVWTTPLDLPIVQPYRKLGSKTIKTNLQNISIEDPDVASPVNSLKQRAAFPPNFIHSLDATHMLMTSLECKEQQLTFASVHDSYWTHACDVERMNLIIRDQFIKLHEQPIMENLRKEFMERYKGYKVPVKLPTDKYYELLRKKVGEIPSPADDGYETILNLEDILDITDNFQFGEPTGLLKEFDNKELAELSSENIKDAFAEISYDLENDIDDPSKHLESEETSEIINDKKPKSKYVYKWFDIAFPSLPEKGNFDVIKVKESKYFFD
nr:12082_t:CDS:10 [Entrophospora candida]